MKFSIEMSVRGEAAEPAAIVATARAAERAGFSMLGYTDHPAPSRKWLEGGGHSTFDPFAGLCFLAAVTERVGLMTYLAVLPYRNPLLLAKSVATVDRLSGGRFTMVAGTGYLRSEFSALGRSFENRNELFDEAVDVIRNVYRDREFVHEGRDFTARGVTYDPAPVQLPHPPIWIGGSSKASRKRVARFGDGWAPLMNSEAFAATVRSAPLVTLDDLARSVDDLRALLEAEGRDPLGISIQVDGLGSVDGPVDATLERAAALEALGVTHAVVRPPDGPTGQVVEAMEAFGSAVIAGSA
ncbi:MAG TPA: LLM class F420-dependent oxidoreductase [Acidimicrobiales bacterium]|nr:LLM class F420-dependent oxidoreductase [Acidimicrobiales bacterium]